MTYFVVGFVVGLTLAILYQTRVITFLDSISDKFIKHGTLINILLQLILLLGICVVCIIAWPVVLLYLFVKDSDGRCK